MSGGSISLIAWAIGIVLGLLIMIGLDLWKERRRK